MNSQARPWIALLWLTMVVTLPPSIASAQPLSQDATDADARELTYLGFVPSAGGAGDPQIWVQTNEPTSAHLEQLSPVHVRLHLNRTTVLRHIWALPMETACFGGPVERIWASPQEEPDSGTAVDVFLKRPARLRLHGDGPNWIMTVLPRRHAARSAPKGPGRPRGRHVSRSNSGS